jgi:ribonuclease HI
VNESIRIFTDGGSRGNPGPAAGGYFLTHPQGKIIEGKGSISARRQTMSPNTTD